MEFQEIIDVDLNLRTEDVKTQGSFESLMISPSTVTNLKNHGYRVPSPVQMKAIPKGLTGLDMLVQAKSGTGKTLVFAILAIENLNLQSNDVQKIIIAPTREIATQIKDTIKTIAHFKTRIGPAKEQNVQNGKSKVVLPTTSDCPKVLRDYNAAQNGLSNRSYDRRAFMELSRLKLSLSEEMLSWLNELGIYTGLLESGKKANFAKEVAELSAKILQLKSSDVNGKVVPSSAVSSEQPKQPKSTSGFVPSRQKAKRKFYMRGELLSIRDSLSKESWWQYALSRFDMSVDPFMPFEQESEVGIHEGVAANETSRTHPSVEAEKMRDVTPKASGKRYSRKDLIAIQNSVPKNLNQYLRCPFEEQLRRQRLLEKKQRAEVPLRDPPEVWRAKVDHHTAWLRNFDTLFKYDVYKEAGRKCEVAVETNSGTSTVAPLNSELEAPPDAGVNKQGNGGEARVEIHLADRVPSRSRTSGSGQEREMKVNAERGTQPANDVAPQASCSEEEGYSSTSEQGLALEVETASAAEQLSEEESCSEDESSCDEEEEQLRRFAEAYRKNIDLYFRW
ncbi:DEAD/DEAH box helicase [Teladorsagia circumcincta]|uniref:RNA helicase n=1 Tax=Teladorsagia circumcincta TaxID=45464 RepID=A0A2G9TU50_TELCI|nr:DEAD/DEAH box helicase [Teladorsagia circumcincta]